MNEQPGPMTATGDRDGDLDRGGGRRPQAPEAEGAEMAQDGTAAAGEDRRRPEAVRTQLRTADRVDAAVHAEQAAGRDPMLDRRGSPSPSSWRCDTTPCWRSTNAQISPSDA